MMTRETTVLYTLLAYNVLLIGIGVWASRRNRDAHDFLLAGGKLGGWVAGLSASASSSSAWTLLGVSGAAYAWGISALWLFPATLGGFLLNWIVIAPRLRRLSREGGELTLSEVVLPATLGEARLPLLRLSAVIICFCFLFYIAAQFDGAGKAFAANFDWSRETSVVIGAGIVMLYTLVGGFWAVSVTDALQALAMMLVAVVLPVVAVAAVSATPTAWDAALSGSIVRDQPGVLGIAFILGTLGIGLGYPGQPHVVNRFMALSDDAALRRGRAIAIGWALVVYTGMLALGLAARALYATVPDGEQALFVAASALLPPVIGGVALAAVLSAIMSTADSQLLAAAAAVAHDWRGEDASAEDAPRLARVVVIVLAGTATAIALFVPADIFSRVLFAWHALGSAFGPLLVARLSDWQLSPSATLAVLLSGFGLTVVANALPNTPGDWVERLLPLGVALSIAFMTRRRAT
ncbi:MAG: sodium/proline symporter [Pseudomonadota bacterium]